MGSSGRLGVAAFIIVALGLGGNSPHAMAQDTRAADAKTRLSEQSAQQQQRARTRIEVRPTRRSTYPGPNSVRQCVAWLQPEHRPSGTVITPQMRCWWTPG
jgi:hypothetical protein